MRAIHATAVLVMTSLVLGSPARADDFPSDVKRTFTTDIPHFFQDDIPCAFGGKPTSGAKASCKDSRHPAAHKTTARKKKRTITKPAASKTPTSASTPANSAPSAGANAGATAGTPSASSSR